MKESKCNCKERQVIEVPAETAKTTWLGPIGMTFVEILKSPTVRRHNKEILSRIGIITFFIMSVLTIFNFLKSKKV